MSIVLAAFTGAIALFAMLDTMASDKPHWAVWVAVIAGLVAMAVAS